MEKALESRWFVLGELVLILAASAATWAFPVLKWPAVFGGLPLFLAGLPWILRMVKRQVRFRYTGLDFLPGVFLITSGVGVWAAYGRELAWAKFWVILAAVWLYYTLSYQSEENLWAFTVFLSVVSTSIAVYFLTTHNWQDQPTKFAFIQQIGRWWMKLRPSLPWMPIRPNETASLLAVTAPYQLALLPEIWKRRNVFTKILCVGAVGICFTALLLTASRGALFATGFVLGISLLWWFSRFLALKIAWRSELIFALCVLPLLISGLGLAWQFPGGIVQLLDKLPGPASASSRVEIARNTLYLIDDFLITGGGLRSFPGLYSQYILNVPYFYISYSHNLFLEVALEQGIFGILAFLLILSIAFWRLSISLKRQPGWLIWASLASLIVMGLHGLVTDAVYSEAGTPFIFFQAGIAAALAQDTQARGPSLALENDRNLGWRYWGSRFGLAITGLLVVLLLLLFRAPIRSKWYADLGAIEMARVELKSFPAGTWQERSSLAPYSIAEKFFMRSLREQSGNPGAYYRLGMIDSLHGDFQTAVTHLENALKQAPGHPGIRKVLGVNYVWLGMYDRAASFLSEVPRAGELMTAYSWWWGTHGRRDLAERAMRMAEQLPGY